MCSYVYSVIIYNQLLIARPVFISYALKFFHYACFSRYDLFADSLFSNLR